MILLEPQHKEALRANSLARRSAQEEGRREPDCVPVVKFFNPVGAATWLATELDDDGDTLFGLADLGFGCPELGSFSLMEIESVRLPYGLRIERDIGFEGLFPLSAWANAARIAGSIIDAQFVIADIVRSTSPTPSEAPASDENPPETNDNSDG
ncbi:DUF2958 domain-containing protein [Sphingobium chungbukense]|uniref:Single-stranded DNA endonuclease n=1 Tax=Sphingobium chungbukense TaxID=56193 RepID=A0A0M3ARF3_9SPHN|nr:DUF2958 domain-containing protein [Sphingobium chungbukense]KKW92493.1 hypothetical protein YP76_05910 [Sphingobium chungbukense]